MNLAFNARFWWPLFWSSYFGNLGSHKGFSQPIEYFVVWCLQEESRLVGIFISILYFSILKVNLMIFCRLNWLTLSLLPEDYNGSQLQGFQSSQAKAIKVNFYIWFLVTWSTERSRNNSLILPNSGIPFFLLRNAIYH